MKVVDKALVAVFVLAYALMLASLLATNDAGLPKAVAIPAATFALASIIRAFVNRQRPYENGGIEPLVKKDTQGKSMPSLHMASATIITFTCFQFWPVPGIALAAACVAIAFTRILGGVHYPSDVLAAILIALICGFTGFYLL